MKEIEIKTEITLKIAQPKIIKSYKSVLMAKPLRFKFRVIDGKYGEKTNICFLVKVDSEKLDFFSRSLNGYDELRMKINQEVSINENLKNFRLICHEDLVFSPRYTEAGRI
jgi:hypothetical protein